MKPYDTPKSKRATEAAARSYVRAHLGWLRGFPIGEPHGEELRWVVLPRLGSQAKSGELKVNREHLRRTEFSRNAAKRKFPNTLVRVVGDVDLWTRSLNKRFEFLKASIHAEAPLPGLENLLKAVQIRRSTRQRVVQLVKEQKYLKPLIISLIWIHWDKEDAFLSALEAVESHAGPIANLLTRLGYQQGHLLVLQCVQLLVDGCDTGFLHLLADKRCWETPLTHGNVPRRMAKALKKLRTQGDVESALHVIGFKRPESHLGLDLVEFVSKLTTVTRKVRMRQLRLVQFLVTDDLLNRWKNWWRKTDAFEREARKILVPRWTRILPEEQDKCQALEKQIKNELGAPKPFRWRDLRNLMDVFCTEATPKAFEILLSCLENLSERPKGKPLTQIFLQSWVGEFREPQRGWGVIVRLLSGQHNLLAQLPGLTSEKQAWISSSLTEGLIETWICEAKPQRLIEPTLEALHLLILNATEWDERWGPFHDYTDWDGLIATIELTSNPRDAAKIIAKIPPNADGLHGEAWTALLHLSELCPEKLKSLTEGWRLCHWSETLTKELFTLMKNPEIRSLITEGLINGEGKRISHLIAQSSLNRSLGLSTGIKPPRKLPSTLNLTSYPSELHPLLEELALWDPKPARAAHQILAQDFPLREKMEAEIGVVRDMAKQADADRKRVLLARALKLERRLTTSPCISDKRLHNYRAKLERRIRYAKLLRWEQNLGEQFRAGFEEKIGITPSEDWLLHERTIQILTALAELPAGFRKLAFQLVKVRCGPEPWDLRSEQPNKDFIKTLDRGGIKVEPWLDGIGPREIEVGSDRLILDLEKDPLEIMRMGEPFDTCLAPGSFNFFSVVSNAADINKRVLYARDVNGTIQGRCLIALTNEGHILIFYVYAHAHREAIESAVRVFVQDLAQAMGTNIVARGQIQNLIASDWYDDGPIDLTGQLKFLHSGSQFEKTLKTLSPRDVVSELKHALGETPLTPMIVCTLAQIETFNKRPELIVPLLPYVGDNAALDPWSRLRFASLTREAGEMTKAFELLRPLMLRTPPRDHDYWIQVQVAEELIALGLPHRALRLIRESRPVGVRDWEDEISERIMVAAKAMIKLFQRRKALELYQIAGKNGCKEATKQADKLKQELGLTDDTISALNFD